MDVLERIQQFLGSLGFKAELKDEIYMPFLVENGRIIGVTIIAVNNCELRIRAENVLQGGLSRANELNRTLHGGIRCVAETDDEISIFCDLPEYIIASDLLERAIVEILFRICIIAEIS